MKCIGCKWYDESTDTCNGDELCADEIRTKTIKEIMEKAKRLQMKQVAELNGSIYRSRSKYAHYIYQHLGHIQNACKELLGIEM